MLLNDINVVLEKGLLSFVDQQVIDYVKSVDGEGLVIAPAWGASSCG